MTILFRAVLLVAILAAPSSAVADPSNLDCKAGPITKIYGRTSWLVYGCSDGRSVIVVTAPGSPAMPFLFTFHWEADGYHLAGAGTGNKKLTDLAFGDLKILSQADIEALLVETQHH
jgi:hypothetical protein